MESILGTIKQLLGIPNTDTTFDIDVIISINTAFMDLDQLGIGPSGGLVITDNSQNWTDLLATGKSFESAKSFIYLKTRLLFDPPTNSFLGDSIERQITEIQWRLVQQKEMEN